MFRQRRYRWHLRHYIWGGNPGCVEAGPAGADGTAGGVEPFVGIPYIGCVEAGAAVADGTAGGGAPYVGIPNVRCVGADPGADGIAGGGAQCVGIPYIGCVEAVPGAEGTAGGGAQCVGNAVAGQLLGWVRSTSKLPYPSPWRNGGWTSKKCWRWSIMGFMGTAACGSICAPTGATCTGRFMAAAGMCVEG